ncbi:hypothetical protein YDYSY3_46150 [Paenibacillus chitinolyticus]|uniref:hypothetical protein n=1 Tax=Paenibacillus chitinolyticus TaxID=79263 RepID=UPI0026E4D94F|nr:hypothetical protein [Paenibacillus chitinolyticus]GKS13615.1 hypothetical protein YDYSY3_46150 [Paenibacillus chitinolyticus]
MDARLQTYLLDLVVAVYQTYVERKGDKEIVKEDPGRVVRGTIPAVASKFEDEFGIFLYKLLGDEYTILIDYPIRIKGDGRITPDVIVVKDGAIQLILELKNDLGYEKADWRGKRDKIIERLNKINTATYSEYNSSTRTKMDKILIVPDNIPYGTVILCQKNGRKRVLDVINDYKNVNCQGDKVPYFILMKDKDTHANDILFEQEMNDYFENVLSTEVTSDWERLEFFLSKHLNF